MRKSRPREKCVLVGCADLRRSSRVGQQQRLHVFITHEERQSTASMGSRTHTTKSLFWTRTLDVNADTWRSLSARTSNTQDPSVDMEDRRQRCTQDCHSLLEKMEECRYSFGSRRSVRHEEVFSCLFRRSADLCERLRHAHKFINIAATTS